MRLPLSVAFYTSLAPYADSFAMQLEFDIGDAYSPSGHALLYFRDTLDHESVAVTYIIILPVNLDIAKYMPPFLAGQVAEMTDNEISSFAFPPAPEKADSYEQIRRIAELRNDDLVYAGTLSMSAPLDMMEQVSEATFEYHKLYQQAHDAITIGDTDAPPQLSDDDDDDEIEDPVHDLIYGDMEEADLLAELTTQLGRMRYAVEGQDRVTATETRTRIRAIGRYLPNNREVNKLVSVASQNTPNASELAQLYLERAYCLYREDYLRLKKIDADIEGLQGQS